MDSNITEQQYLGTDLQLSEPHFEEEATLLSARRVVPLHEVKAEKRSGRRLTVGLALVAALIVGALGATLIYKQRGQTPATVESASQAFSEAATEPPSTTPAGGATSDSPTAASQAPEKSDGPARDGRNVVIMRPKKAAPSVEQSSGSSRKTETVRDEDIDPAERKAERRAQRMEARRLRWEENRRARGEMRGRRVQPTDDVLRIREIFEGRRRP